MRLRQFLVPVTGNPSEGLDRRLNVVFVFPTHRMIQLAHKSINFAYNQ